MNPIGPLSRLTRILVQSWGGPAGAGRGPEGGGFGQVLGRALLAAGPGLLSQLADLIALKNAVRLGGGGGGSSRLLSGLWRAAMPPLPRLPRRARLPLTGTSEPVLPRLPRGGKKLTPPRPGSPSRGAGGRREFDELIAAAAARYGVDQNLVRAVITAESDFDPHTVSRAGAMGLMQLMPETAAELGVSDPFDPAQNIDAGTRYLAMLLERFEGDEAKALAAYNWGPGNVEAGRPLPAETRTYLERVARYKTLYAQGFRRVA